MDKGAHFFRTDLQVHTPRDIMWSGVGAESDEERKQYALEFVRACREKDINAVAITDHHDMEFFGYIKEAAQQETDANGEPIRDSRKLVVFPGMELTLGLPCQALLIFDANFPTDLFQLVYNSLNIVPSAANVAKTAAVDKLEHLTGLHVVQEKLDGHQFLRGRYILLPNVSDGGNHTLLRSGFHSHYKNMTCVGGYTDKGRMGNGTIAITEGRNAQYGNKAIGVFHTSDNRSRDFSDLGGSNAVWIKWATPTAEALRQACLARTSRLSVQKPTLPEVFITGISVSNSKFMGPFNLEFNRQSNALIGGRGTGKSTILEYLRWALCDEPPAISDDEAQNYASKRQKLIEGTLAAQSGDVQVDFMKNGVLHSIRRSTKDNRVQIKIDQGDYEITTEENVRTILPIQGYSQKQLSNVAVRIDQLQRFVRAPVEEEVRQSERDLTNLENQMRAQYAQVVQYVQLIRQRENLDKEAKSLSSQIAVLKKNLTGLSDQEQKIIEQHELVEQEKSILAEIASTYDQLIPKLDDISGLLDVSSQFDDAEIENLPNKDILKTALSGLKTVFGAAQTSIAGIREKVSQELSPTGTVVAPILQIEKAHEGYEAQYQAALKNSSAHTKSLQQITGLEKRLREIRTNITGIDAELKKIGQPDVNMKHLRSRWKTNHDLIASLLAEQCTKLTELSDGLIKAVLLKHAQFDVVKKHIAALLKGTGIRSAKIDELFGSIVGSTDPLTVWEKILSELELLAQTEKPISEGYIPPETEQLSKYFQKADLLKLAAQLTPEGWLNLVLARINSVPVFSYRARENDYIDFADASAGQQATALLWALLNQDGPPLIIDQPEDDLDSQTVMKITDQFLKSKGKRQIIFTSHNANLVVIGDAELVICCDYRVAGQQSTGNIKLTGAIDMQPVRDEITQVMEGGEKAFNLRRERYGY